MNTGYKLIFISLLLTLSACATVEQPSENNAVSDSSPPLELVGNEPKQTLFKAGKTLELFRVMDGAVCKNDLEGAKGSFLLYAYINDMERIKREQGAEVLKGLEHKIEAFSEQVLQQAINQTNLSIDPFALGEDQAQAKIAREFSKNFRQSVDNALRSFERETRLTLDVTAYTPSFVFFQNGCDTQLLESVILESEDKAQADTY